MTIKSLDARDAAPKWDIQLGRTATRTTVAAQMFSVFDIAGVPGAGTLAVGNTANGLVHTDLTAGYPVIPPVPAGKGWYLNTVDYSSSVAGNRALYDCLFSCGAYAFNANTTLASQPSFENRCKVAPDWAASTAFAAGDIVVNHTAPIKAYLCVVGGTSAGSGGPTGTGTSITDNTCTWMYLSNGVSYSNLELLVEQVTAATGIQNVACGYAKMETDGTTLTTGRATGTVAFAAAPIVGRMMRLPLQSGDANIARLDSITGSVATVGTFNVHIMRRISPFLRAAGSNGSDVLAADRTGLRYLHPESALREVQWTDGTTSITNQIMAELALG